MLISLISENGEWAPLEHDEPRQSRISAERETKINTDDSKSQVRVSGLDKWTKGPKKPESIETEEADVSGFLKNTHFLIY